MPSDTIIEPGAGAAVLADNYTRELGAYCKQQLPVTLSNPEYLTRISALIVALNRMLAEYVVTSAHVHECDLRELLNLTEGQFVRNVARAHDAINGVGIRRQ